jgi:hypothetical protein
LASPDSTATDRFESDDSPFSAPLLIPSAAPQTHDLQATSGVADVDFFFVTTRNWRSYEIRVSSPSSDTTVANLVRMNNTGATVLQTATGYATSVGTVPQLAFLRWQVNGSSFPGNIIRVTGQTTGTANSQYNIEYLDTTLFCPRYNNAAGQTSVLLIQAAPEGANTCSYTALFFDQAGTLTGSQSGTLAETDMTALSTPTVPGVANTRGSARITHDCGHRNVVAKLVALEPPTGFSFDTACSSK